MGDPHKGELFQLRVRCQNPTDMNIENKHLPLILLFYHFSHYHMQMSMCLYFWRVMTELFSRIGLSSLCWICSVLSGVSEAQEEDCQKVMRE